MFRAGLQAILVKVAGVGLGVDTVGRDLSSMMPLFRRLVSVTDNVTYARNASMGHILQVKEANMKL